MAGNAVDSHAVFLNVPFDRGYERQFLALIGTLVALGRKPRCVLEVVEKGQGRLERIVDHLQRCRVSIHDLSRVGTPVRFNMPFELGIAFSLARAARQHTFVLLEKKEHRLARTLSDLRGIEPLIHGGGVRRTVACVLDVLRTPTDTPEPDSVVGLYRALTLVAGRLKRQYGQKLLYTRSIYFDLVAAALEIAVERKLLPGRSAYRAA